MLTFYVARMFPRILWAGYPLYAVVERNIDACDTASWTGRRSANHSRSLFINCSIILLALIIEPMLDVEVDICTLYHKCNT